MNQTPAQVGQESSRSQLEGPVVYTQTVFPVLTPRQSIAPPLVINPFDPRNQPPAPETEEERMDLVAFLQGFHLSRDKERLPAQEVLIPTTPIISASRVCANKIKPVG